MAQRGHRPMTLRGWVLLILFVLAFLWFAMHYPELIRQYYCPIAGLLVICGGIYSLWTGRLVDEFGYEIKGRWVRIIGIVGIALGLWILQNCPTGAARHQLHANRIRLNYTGHGFSAEIVRAASQACPSWCNGECASSK